MKKLIAFIIILISSLVLVACKEELPTPIKPDDLEPGSRTQTISNVMGSFLEVRLYTSDKATFDQHMQNIVDIYTEIHIISDYVDSPKPDSRIINNLFTINEQMLSSQTDVEFEINQTFYEMLLLADELRNNTNGHFNVGIGRHIRLWKSLIPALKRDDLSEAAKDDMLEITFATLENMDVLEESYELKQVDDQYFVTVKKGVLLDFGAFAKGYGTQKVYDYIRSVGIEKFYINGGSSAISYGLNDREDRNYFNIGLKHPIESGKYYAEVHELKNIHIATSGNYEESNYVIYKGVRYHHIISPITKKPTENYYTVTMIGEDASVLDPYSTAIFSMSVTETNEFIQRNDLKTNYVLYQTDGNVVSDFNHFGAKFIKK